MNIKTIEEVFDSTKRFNTNYLKTIKDQIDVFLSAPDIPTEEVGDYFILTFKTEFFVTKKDKTIYKSFFTKQDAINYCLDKINTESKQIDLL